MGFFTKLSNGWQLAKTSFIVLRENKQLLLFPVLSGISLLFVMGSFAIAMFGLSGWNFEAFENMSTPVRYVIAFGFYFINYFVIVFFNMALIHCTHLYFNGEEPTLNKGMQFSLSRIGAIFSWALVAATVGLILRVIQENVGWLGKIITGLIGIVWNVTTFFVVPVLAYENLGPVDAVKRSGSLMREKWGESIGAGFSIGLVGLIGGLGIVFVSILLALIHPAIGGVFGLLSFIALWVVLSAAETVFVSAAYHNVTGNPVHHFNDAQFSELFVAK